MSGSGTSSLYKRSTNLDPDFYFSDRILTAAASAQSRVVVSSQHCKKMRNPNPDFYFSHRILTAAAIAQSRVVVSSQHCKKMRNPNPDFYFLHRILTAPASAQSRVVGSSEHKNEKSQSGFLFFPPDPDGGRSEGGPRRRVRTRCATFFCGSRS